MRLDIFIANKLGISRSFSASLIKNNRVLINDKTITSPKFIVGEIDKLEIVDTSPEIRILHSEEDFLIVHKPHGMSVARSENTPKWEAVLNEKVNTLQKLAETDKSFEFGLANRIDKETEGIMILCKTKNFLDNLIDKFKTHQVGKLYKAYFSPNLPRMDEFFHFICKHGKKCFGYQKDCICELFAFQNLKLTMSKGKKRSYLDPKGKETESYFLKKDDHYEFILVTGHNHQIRVTMADHFKTPIHGDEIYGKSSDRMYLFSYFISF